MSTSLLYHAFCVRGYQYLRSQFKNGGVEFVIQRNLKDLCCPMCRSSQIKRRGTVTRRFRTLPIGKKGITLVLKVQRVECKKCGCIRQDKIDFASAKRTYTRSFERYVLELSKYMTIKDVALHLNVSWDVVKKIQKRYLHKHFSKPKLKHLKLIAIDEISIGRNHKYLTILLDLHSGAVVFVGEGKGANSLKPFWRRLKSSRAKIDAVAIDMSPAYIDAVMTNLPDAKIVFDHFHIIKLFNEKLSELRRAIQREVTDIRQKEVLKGIMWILLKNPENLNKKRNERQRLDEALQINEPLATGYYMKEDLRQLWSQENKEKADTFLEDWIARAQSSGIRILQKFANTLAAHRTGILAYYDFPISTGPLEGTNNKIKTMKRQAYGFRDIEFFKLKILGIHKAKYALVG